MAILARLRGVARTLLLGLPYAALAAAGAPAQAAGPDYAAASGAVFLPYLNAPMTGAPITRPPALGLSFGGGRLHRATMDTGSTGIVVAARSIPNIDQLPSTGPGTLTYSSSGRVMKGIWVLTQVTISGAGGASITTRPIPVLAVQEVACLKTARNCKPRQNPTGIGMIGIGFARQGDHQAQSTPDHNPFLSAAGMGHPGTPGKVTRGYVVTRRGVTVGLDASTTAGFSYVKLDKSPMFPDWAATPACLSVAGKTPPACGTLLMDTGVTTMYLRVPPEQLAGQTVDNAKGAPVLKPGTAVTVQITPGTGGIGYTFNTGDAANSLAPFHVTVVTRGTDAAFVNTSARFLNGFDYLYDADAGYVGFRSLKPN